MAYLRSRQQESLSLDQFFALGLVALAYDVAALSQANNILAVFAAGLALQRVKEETVADGTAAVRHPAGLQIKRTQEARATDPAQARACMMQAVRGFNEQLERIGEVAVVLGVG